MSEPTEKKSRFSFNCTKCGFCCNERGPIPLVLDDLIKWVKNDVISSILPHVSFIKTDLGTIDLVLDQKNDNPYGMNLNPDVKNDKKDAKTLTCPFYNQETKQCVIYENRPLSCRTYPLEYDGSQFLVVDAENCSGLGNGSNSKEELKILRQNAKKMYKKLQQMRISMPILAQAMQPFIIQELMKMQEKAMKEFEKMTPEQRKAFEDQFKS